MLVGFNKYEMYKHSIHFGKTHVFLSVVYKLYENSGLPRSVKFLGVQCSGGCWDISSKLNIDLSSGMGLILLPEVPQPTLLYKGSLSQTKWAILQMRFDGGLVTMGFTDPITYFNTPNLQA